MVVTIAEPGTYHLDGHQALAFVRNRTGSSDSHRMQRQRCTLRALAAQIDGVTVATRFPQIARAVRESAKSNIPLSFLPDLVEYAATLDLNDIATVAFGYPYYAHELNFRNLPIVDPERIRAKVRAALDGGGDGGGRRRSDRGLPGPPGALTAATGGRRHVAAGAPATTTNAGGPRCR